MKVFDTLDLTSKRDILKTKAVLVFASAYHHYIIRLYSWDSLFIEEYYDTEEKRISRISVAGDADMMKYLSKIDLDKSITWK